MAISLSKGQKISLKKDSSGNLLNFCVGANWGAIESSKFLQFFGQKIKKVDLDLSVALFDSSNKLQDLVYYGKLFAPGIIHSGDDRVGDVGGDDGLDNEIIKVDLSQIRSDITQLVFVLNSYNLVKFDDIPFASIRLYEGTPSKVDKIFATYNIKNGSEFIGKYAMILGKLYLKNGEWKFSAIGEATKDQSLDDLLNRSVTKIL